MSKITIEEEPGIQYILNDTEFILDPSELKSEVINDVIYTDGNQAIVVNGHFVQENGEVPTLVLQDGEDISQYLINDNQEELLIADLENSSIDQSHEAQQIIQYVDEEGNITDAPDIVYINEDGVSITTQGISPQYQIAELMDTSQNSTDPGEETNIIRIPQEQDVDNSFIGIAPKDWYQCAVVKDGNIYITNTTTSNDEDVVREADQTEQIDISGITGKNLLTGQVVTLESYMNKIKKRIKAIPSNSVNGKSRPKHNLNAFVNRKFNLGLTVGGKRLVGKIVHVGSRDTAQREQEQQVAIIDNEIDSINLNENENDGVIYTDISKTILDNNFIRNDQMHVQTKLLSKKSDQFQRITKTLCGLMTMENVKKKLLEKSIQIELVDQYWYNAKKSTKNISFISGCMESKVVPNKNDELVEEWTFVPDTLRTENVRSHIEKRSQKKYPDVTNLTILTTYQKNSKNVKVVIDSSNLECRHCGQTFHTNNNWVTHVNEEHFTCELCCSVFENAQEVEKHKKTHVETCTISNCNKSFVNEFALKKHLLTHKLEPFKCQLCSYSGLSEKDLKLHFSSHSTSCNICGDVFINATELNAHKKMNHSNQISVLKKQQTTRYYACDICKRTFSRQSNLQRHAEVHKGAENLYRCAICGCSYHYISSLTRHIVQNHVQLQRPALTLNENEIEIEMLY